MGAYSKRDNNEKRGIRRLTSKLLADSKHSNELKRLCKEAKPGNPARVGVGKDELGLTRGQHHWLYEHVCKTHWKDMFLTSYSFWKCCFYVVWEMLPLMRACF